MKTILFLCLVVVSFPKCVTTPETGRRAFIITSEAQEAQLGAEAYAQMLQKERLSTNSRWIGIVERLGKRIAQAANRPDYAWEFKLIDSPVKNAFCLPGGKVAIYTGILSVAQTEGGLAAVMGHEVAHATARHGGQRMTMALGTQLGLVGADAILGGKDSQQKSLLLAAIGAGVMVGAVLPYSRSNESEADEMGLIYMARAGYDPREGPKFWGRFAGESKGAPPEFLSTHPNSEGRKRAMETQLSKVLPIYERSPKYGVGETF